MVRRRACCAPEVMESASSRMTSFWRPWGRVTFFWAKALMRLRTTSMPVRGGGGSVVGAALGGTRRGCTSLVAGVQFQDGFFVCVAEELTGEAEDGGCFANAGHA